MSFEAPGALQKEKTPNNSEKIRRILQRHVVDLPMEELGRRELIKQMAGASLGVKSVSVDRAHPVIDIESVVLAPGRKKVLMGPNGSGKSTLFDAFMERDAFFNMKSGAGASVVGKPVHLRERTRIARLDQEEILGEINDVPVGEVLSIAADHFKIQFPVDWEDPDKYEQNLANQEVHVRIETLVNKITALFGVDDFLARKVSELSGGERTKLSLFAVLLSEPDVLFLDEPTNHLDLQSISKLTALFDEYKKAGISIVSASHVDWFLQDAGADGVIEIAWDGEKREVRDSQSPYSKYIKNPSREQAPVISGEIEWLQRDYGYKIGDTIVESPVNFSIPDSPLQGVSLPIIHGGDLVVLSGNNGTGKTKLMETIVAGKGERLPRKGKGVQLAYLPQFWPEDISARKLGDFFDWVKDTSAPLSTGSSVHPEQSARNLFIKLTRDLSFSGGSGEGLLNRPLAKFSGGEQRLLWFLIVSSLRNIDALILDEPTNHMDRNLQQKIASAIQKFPGAVILSTHDKNLITLLTKAGGTIQGTARKPHHVVLEKLNGKTSIRESKTDPVAHMNDLMKKAVQQARQMKI